MRTRTVHIPSLIVLAASLLPAATSAQQRVAVPERARILSSQPAPSFSIGAEEGESWELLSNVRSVAFDRQDNMYVLDAGNFRVLVFDRAGRFVRQIGKQGEGPGEITFAQGMVVDANGDVVVWDMGRGGYTIYDADGTYRTTIPASQDGRSMGGSGMQAAPRGGVVARTSGMVRPGGPGPMARPTGPIKTPIIHHPLKEGAAVRTLYEIEMPPPRVIESGSANNRRVMFSMAPPVFAPQVGWGILPNGGLAISSSDAYQVEVLDENGRTVRVFATGQKPRKVSNRDREMAREQRRKQMQNPTGGMNVTNVNGRVSYSFGGRRGDGPSEAEIEEQLRTLEFAETVPLVRGVFTDPQGRIWVQRTSDRNPVEAGDIDLLDHTGRYIGSVRGHELPAAVSASGLAAWITRDEMDIEKVVVKRLPADWK